ncbi:MAG: carboxypeptidase-like regulatory domain-containing protein [Rikenellaceae bacterium]|nr:carboxypeptidase-like regulatory domain-containing protein [Rikenellaceae bacterium]
MAGIAWGGYGQSSGNVISGKVVYGDDQSPVPYAILTAPDGSRGVSCDSLGHFQFVLSGTGNNEQLLVSGFGAVRTLVSLNPSADQPLTIALERQAFILPEVVVQGSRQGATSLIGDTTRINTSSYQFKFKRGVELGVLVKNKRRITLDALYIHIKDTPQSHAPMAVRIKKGPSMRPNRLYDSNEFTDILPELLICHAERPGMLKIDLSGYNIQIGSDFLILLSPASSNPEFDYTVEEPIVQIMPNGRVVWSPLREPVGYYGAVLNEYPAIRKDIFWLTGEGGQYAYIDVPRMETSPPMIAVGYRKK